MIFDSISGLGYTMSQSMAAASQGYGLPKGIRLELVLPDCLGSPSTYHTEKSRTGRRNRRRTRGLKNLESSPARLAYVVW